MREESARGRAPRQEVSGALAALEPAEDASRRVHLEGTVLLPDGGPARGAVVVTSAGGSAAVRADGSFALDVAVAPDADAVLVSAVANGSTGSLIAHRRLDGLSGASARDAGVLLLSASAGCAPEWLPTFGGQPGTSHGVGCAAVYDDGSGPALYVGGGFTSAGGVPAARVARWDGEAWSKVGGGVNGGVEAMTVLDDGSGSGPALYVARSFTSAGGKFAKSVARWNGNAWSALGSGVVLGLPLRFSNLEQSPITAF